MMTIQNKIFVVFPSLLSCVFCSFVDFLTIAMIDPLRMSKATSGRIVRKIIE